MILYLPQVFPRNTDRDTVVYHDLTEPIIEARYIRVRPTDWRQRISMRMELYTCYLRGGRNLHRLKGLKSQFINHFVHIILMLMFSCKSQFTNTSASKLN